MKEVVSSTEQKALALNRDARPYGTFAEIGGGQEVARWFFYVGGAAGTVGLPSVKEIVDDKYYADLPGGVLESAGRLFKRAVKMIVYPGRDPLTGRVYTVESAPLPSPWQYLRALLLEIRRLEPMRNYNESYLAIFPQDVLTRIERNDSSWEKMVPPIVAEMIKAKRLFSHQANATTAASAHNGEMGHEAP